DPAKAVFGPTVSLDLEPKLLGVERLGRLLIEHPHVDVRQALDHLFVLSKERNRERRYPLPNRTVSSELRSWSRRVASRPQQDVSGHLWGAAARDRALAVPGR